MKTLISEFGSMESEMQEVDELTALYDQVEQNQLPDEEGEPTKPLEEPFRDTFPEQIDSTSWKAILKALGDGSSKEEIVKDVLGCSDQNKQLGLHYLEFLKQKFL